MHFYSLKYTVFDNFIWQSCIDDLGDMRYEFVLFYFVGPLEKLISGLSNHVLENIQSLYTYIINVHHLYIYTKVPFVKKKIRRDKADVLDNENAWLIKKALHSI